MARTRADLVVSTAPNRAPVWTMPIGIQVIDGQPKRIPIRQFVMDPDGDPLTIAVATPIADLAAEWGFSYDQVSNEIVYNGRPTGVAPDSVLEVDLGLRLSADDGR